MKKSLTYCLLTAILLVTFTESCQDSTFQVDENAKLNSQEASINRFSDESPDCVYDVDLSNDEDFLELHELSFSNNIIGQKLIELDENNDREGFKNYTCQIERAIAGIPDGINASTFEQYLNSEIDDSETVTYIVQLTNTMADFIAKNNELFEMDHDELACILGSEFNNLNFKNDQAYPRNGCINACSAAYDVCIGNGFINGGAVMGAGATGALAILSYGWYTGAAAGTAAAAAASGIGGIIGGVFTVGAAVWTCERDYSLCVKLCQGSGAGGSDQEGGPLEFGCNG